MRNGEVAELRMQKVLGVGKKLDSNVHNCMVLRYDDKQEYLYLVLQSGELTELSLDAVYTCNVYTEKEEVSCTGRVRERYRAEAGNIVKIQVENGFYKINIKSVDKQRG